MKAKLRRPKEVSAFDLALEACRALVPCAARARPDVRRAKALARFAVAMCK